MPASFNGHPFNLRGILDNSWHFNRSDFWVYDNAPNDNNVKFLTYSYSTNASSQFRSIYDAAFAELASFLDVDFLQTADEVPLKTISAISCCSRFRHFGGPAA